MSSYRDDTQETATASDDTYGRMRTIAEEVVTATATLLFGLTVLTTDTAIASDSVTDSRYQLIHESAQISDSLLGGNSTQTIINESARIRDTAIAKLHARTDVVEQAAASELISDSLRSVIVELATISDATTGINHAKNTTSEKAKITDTIINSVHKVSNIDESFTISETLTHRVRGLIIDTAAASDTWTNQRTSAVLITEQARIRDHLIGATSELIQDSVSVSDSTTGKLHANTSIIDSLVISDLLQQQVTYRQPLSDSLVISDTVTDHLFAKTLFSDLLFIEDSVIDNAATGFAWTANSDTWAMSRYQDYQFNELTVINGVLYGVSELGVYRVNVPSPVDAQITTGKVDLGGDSLVHPLGAYLEYELGGNAKSLSIGVSTTQSGVKQSYYYPLPNERANELTNGRVMFGRGLRGRHFAFDILITGEHGYLNDLSIELASTKRRV